ncbi:lipase [Ilyonectria sp. MPI-CAGE-AT-0026]|nr:lipase [Ilyonectria sp. MPI-CAGE-AT-0026]
MAQTLNDPDGLVNLQNLAREVERSAPDNKSVPIVFVPGFSGWGAPLFGALNYFGGVIDIPKLLVDRGYTVIVTPVAPISTNWERACELYRQLTFGQFSTVNSTTNSIKEVYDVDVNYGDYFAEVHGPEQTRTTGRRRAILFSNSPDFRNWTWGPDHKVYFVCHSQGGNTVRYLISLIANSAGTCHPTYFSQAGRDNWTISIATLRTPHKETTIINVLESFLARARNEAVGLDMLVHMEAVDGPVWKWLNSDNNGLYDNSIEGVYDLSQKGQKAISSFPIRIENFVRGVMGMGNIPIVGWLMKKIINAFTSIGWEFVTTEASFRSFGQWVTEEVITRILQERGYHLVLPNPGKYNPQKDVIPILLPTVYAMGGQKLTRAQKDLLGPNLGDWYQNDGIVNTESMPGPHGCVRSINSLPDFDFSSPGKRGIYWHLGVNDQMDHADEIGIFINADTVRLRIPCW